MIYIAAPLFNPRERDYNLRLKGLIDYPVYLPQEDGELVTTLIEEGASIETAVQTVHQNDVKALRECRLMIAVLDGAHVDSGVAYEIGFFSALGKPVIGLHTDNRHELPFGHNPMIAGALSYLVRNESDLIIAITKVLDQKS
jgi:nucleoside 2-deoxyribosyltransferase